MAHSLVSIFFNHPKGCDNIIDLFLYQPQHLNTIQMMLPHIHHYLTTVLIPNKDIQNCRQMLKDLVKVIQQESYIKTQLQNLLTVYMLTLTLMGLRKS